jgi:predicted  nucleic acid-binding Zn-ribbon protein
MSALDELLAVQELDAAIDQIPHRRQRLPERSVALDTAAEVARLEAKRAAAVARADVATKRIDELETAGAARATKKARLEQQLRTVFAPKEAEALMREIARIDEDRSTADDEELRLLDEVESAEAEVTAADKALGPARSAAEESSAALAAAEAVLADEAATLQRDREATSQAIEPELFRRYESMRTSFGGTAIARVVSGHCGACHLGLSRAFLDSLKNAGADALIECEQCGRLLVH